MWRRWRASSSGLVADSLTPARFGAAALAHTLVGYLASWGRSLFFADNMLVNAGFVAAGLWLRDLVLLLASGTAQGRLLVELTVYSPLQALTYGAVRHPGARRLPGVVRHPARRMNGFDSYRVRERADIARLVLIAAFLVLVGAFFRTQVIQHEKFQLRAETNRLRPIPLTPPRGTIFDRKGDVIAENVPGYSVKLLAPSVDSLRAVLARVAPIRAARHRADDGGHPALRQRARYQPAVIFGDASFETIARLEEHRAVLPGLVIQSEPKRLYPAGKAVAHLVGYVAEVTEADLTASRFPGAGLGSIVGKAGLEREYDDSLRGGEGVRYIEVNARGRLVREDAGSAALPPTPGQADQDDDRPRPAAVHRQHLACRDARRDGRDDARAARCVHSTPLRPTTPTRSSAASRASSGGLSTTIPPGRCSIARSRRDIRPPRPSSSR